MKRVLVYIEPHPIRNGFDEFGDAASLIGKAMASQVGAGDFEFRIFCNNSVADRLITETPELAVTCIRPEADERMAIVGHYRHWGTEAIQNWLSLTRGEGEISEFYESVIERIYSFFEFDVIITWSENGAVRNFARKNDIVVIHTELGPTRSPFRRTVYFDSRGTNGNASIVDMPASCLDTATLSPDAWVASWAGVDNSDTAPSVYDVGTTANSEILGYLPWRPFVYVALQLADDLNTLAHSEFSSPIDFLQKVLPVILGAGFDAVIKPHPAADARPFNLAAESSAIRYAKALGESVHVLPRRMGQMANSAVVAQSACLCTINSSMAFEAILVGKPAIVLGNAGFNAAGVFFTPLSELEASIKNPSVSLLQQKAVSFGLQHYLIPLDLITEGNGLSTVIDFFCTTHSEDPTTNIYWKKWTQAFDFSSHVLDPSLRDIPSEGRKIADVAGNIGLFRATNRRVTVRTNEVTFRIDERLGTTSASAKRNDARFMGYIDHVGTNPDGSVVSVGGWAAEVETHVPPIIVYTQAEGEVLSAHRVIKNRPDVVEFLDTGGTELRGFRFDIPMPAGRVVDDIDLLLLSADNEIQVARLIVGDLQMKPSSEE
ncbi:GT99 family glycosyltransferase N-terminal domain-containing protein [Brevundimonas nasdae]|uniref:GT99 family glycosyltransferase N-terminal domain-containing protein n=1 Tax=Brevundimonas nasdae TaxID=172043 RepID=UPI000A06BE85|nr:hypothetical protein [Brevundimonas nasdae]